MWEDEALTALRFAVESLEFDKEQSVVVAPVDEGYVTLDSEFELECHLTEVYNEAWYAYVPFDGGCAVFEDDASSAVSEAMDTIDDELRAIGWRN